MGAWLAASALALAGAALGVCAPPGALIGIAVLLPWDFALELGPVTVYVNEAYLVGAGLALLSRGWTRERLRDDWRLVWPLLPFALALALSLAGAQNLAAGAKQILRWGEFGLVYFLAARAVRTRAEGERLLAWLLGAGALAAVIGLVQVGLGDRLAANLAHLAGRGEAMHGVSATRAYGTFGHPNQFAGYLALLLPPAFAAALAATRVRDRWLLGGVCVALGAALALTLSRGGWLGAAAGLVVTGAIVLRHDGKRALLILAAAVLAGGALVTAVPALHARLGGFSQAGHDEAVTGRLAYQRLAWEMVRERPVFGHGAGNYPEALDRRMPRGNPERRYLDSHIHNLYSQLAIETGLAGVAAFLFFVGVWFWRGLRAWRRTARAGEAAVLVGLLAGAGAFLLHNNFDVLLIYARGIHLALVMGLALAWMKIADVSPGLSGEAGTA